MIMSVFRAMSEESSEILSDSLIRAMGNKDREAIVVDENLTVRASSDTINFNVAVDSPLPELSQAGRISEIPSNDDVAPTKEVTPFTKVLEDRTPLIGKYAITGKNGLIEYVTIDGEPLADESDATFGLFTIDIITRQEGLREAHDRLNTIIEALGDPVYVCDPDPKFTYVNDPFADLTGYTKDELMNSHPHLLKSHESQNRVREAIRDILSDDGPDDKTVEVEIKTKGGDVIPCEDHIGVLLQDGRYNGTAGVLRDISTRKNQREQVRQQKEQLEQFVSILTHDIRNPLNIIDGYSQQLKTEANASQVEKIRRAADRMRDLIDDTLALHRETDTVEDLRNIPIAKIADKAWQNVETADADLHVRNKFSIECNPDRLCRLFENLYRNAIEHNDKSVTIDVGEYSTIGTSTRDSCSGFYVADDGTGIDSDNRKKVFDFGETSSQDGTGLGLPIVKRVADAHGWDVKLMDSATGGAKFVFIGVETEKPKKS
jgi:PAS domain S-box-containing protein